MTNNCGFPYMHMWLKVELLLLLQQMVDGATSDNLKHILLDAMILYGDLTQENIVSKLITFGVNGVIVFQGVKIGAIVQLKD